MPWPDRTHGQCTAGPPGGGPELPHRLRKALEWWDAFLASSPTRTVPLAPVTRRRVILYTDAAGDGGVGLVARTPTGVVWSASVVPSRVARRFHGRANAIVAHELAAATSALAWLCSEEDTEVLVFLGNQNAETVLRNGHSKVEGLHEHAAQAWRVAAARRQLLVVARVSSKDNPADEPSRSGRRPEWLERAEHREWDWSSLLR